MMKVHVEYPAEEFLKLVNTGKQIFQVGDKTFQAHTNSKRLQIIADNPYCVICDMQATVARLEQDYASEAIGRPPHFNIYGIDEQGNYILFTRDHIIPRSDGGTDDIINQQTMCQKCNAKKGASRLSQLSEKFVTRKTIFAAKQLLDHILASRMYNTYQDNEVRRLYHIQELNIFLANVDL